MIAVEPVLAQSSSAAFCDKPIADTIRNIFRIIMLGGPLVGGVIALGATVGYPSWEISQGDTVRRSHLSALSVIAWSSLENLLRRISSI